MTTGQPVHNDQLAEAQEPDLDVIAGEPEVPEEYGLALSGGGIRATLFHLGAIIRLNELGHLGEINRISGVSGGSIAASLLAWSWNQLGWENGRATQLRDVYEPLITKIASAHIDIPVIAMGFLPLISPAGLIAVTLDDMFFKRATLQDLPDNGPRFVFVATEMATGTAFRFSKAYMGSYRLGLVYNPRFTISAAVAASAAFPPVASPFYLHVKPERWRQVRGADLFDRKDLRTKLALVDGGAYDNLALQPITRRCNTLLVSDAGGNLGIEKPGWKWWSLLMQGKRTLDIAVSQGRALRRSGLMTHKDEHPFALWRTRTDPNHFVGTATSPFAVADGWPEYLSTRTTRLWPFNETDRKHLVNWGYLTSDIALRSYIWKQDPEPAELPYPDASFERKPDKRPDVAGEPIRRS